ncbi:peptidylprolyl isomerase [Seohaeicola saemankumensis]|nr:peptidylprolyl isomerase [Seohaeicola saemankumensis]MCA0870385.1 peptidylprolyl isomerase [Seohaeicola saemankumensis]
MPKGLTFLSAFAVSAMLAMPLTAAEPDADTVVARVNGEEITLGHMIVARANLPEQYQQLPPEVLYNAILDQLIQQNALKQSNTDDVPQFVELSLENERRALLAANVIEQIMSDSVSEAGVRAAYDEKYADGFGGDEYNASHILVETEEEAQAIKTALDQGADFAETAKEKSTGPSGPSGGELGWFGTGRMVPEFEAAVESLQPQQISDPVQTQFGWHVIKLNEKRKSAAPSFEEVGGEIADELRQRAFEARVDELMSAAKVERPEIEGLSPEILQNVDLVRN